MTAAASKSAPTAYPIERIRSSFPLLQREVHGRPLVYLDNANTTQKPAAVLDAVDRYYREFNANIHRASHLLGELATAAYEGARARVARFLGASSSEIVFVRNATEAINLCAWSWGRANLRPGDEVLLTTMEHHANIVPWQLLAEITGARVVEAPILDNGDLDLAELERLLSPRTRLLGITQMSNALGTVNDVARAIRAAHSSGALVMLDAAQSAYHMPIDVHALGCDFLAVSGHKLYGPMGIGALYGRRELLEAMPPFMGGGDMIRSVSFGGTTYNDVPWRFEAGTPNVAGAIGMAAALDFMSDIGLPAIEAYEGGLVRYGTEALLTVPGLRLVGEPTVRASVWSFTIDGIHPHDIGTALDAEGIAIRTGQHCAHPVLNRLGVPATARISLGCYNTRAELDTTVDALHRIAGMFR